MTTWTNPADAGTLDLANGTLVTETHWDALRRDVLIIGGTTGRRPEFRREWLKAADKASAATVDLSTVEGNLVHITGTTTITALGTVNAGTIMALVFDGALTVTHHATSLILAGGVNLVTAAGTVLIVASEGSGNWRELARNATGVANSLLVSRFTNENTLNVTASSGYTDFGGAFTTSPTLLAGDKVHITVTSIFKKATGSNASIVIDRGGTKLPGAGAANNVYTDLLGSYIPFHLEVWDTPGAGAFTYKPQVHSGDANVATAGGGLRCLYVVEVWR